MINSPIVKQRSFLAFSLIEILLTVSILAILSALSIPAIGSMRKKAEASKTAHNLRQIGTGIAGYAGENNMTFPHRVKETSYRLDLTSAELPGTGGSNWREAIHRYTGASYKPGSAYNFYNHPLWYSGNAARLGNHFGANPFLTQGWWQCSLLRIPEPSKVVLVGEINHASLVVDPRDQPVFDGDTISRYRLSQPGQSANYLFADGHVETLKGPRNPNEPEHRSMWRFD